MLLTYTDNTLPINIYNQNYSYNNDRLLFLYILGSIIFIFFIIVFLSIRQRSERIKFKIKRVLLFEALFVIPAFLLFLYTKNHRNINFNVNTAIIFIFIIDFLFIMLLPKQKRIRYISAETKKKLIENFERKTGKTYNSREYEIHHIIPYSKGGNNTIDNLKLIPKHKNRAINNKSPWWDIFGK